MITSEGGGSCEAGVTSAPAPAVVWSGSPVGSRPGSGASSAAAAGSDDPRSGTEPLSPAREAREAAMDTDAEAVTPPRVSRARSFSDSCKPTATTGAPPAAKAIQQASGNVEEPRKRPKNSSSEKAAECRGIIATLARRLASTTQSSDCALDITSDLWMQANGVNHGLLFGASFNEVIVMKQGNHKVTRQLVAK